MRRGAHAAWLLVRGSHPEPVVAVTLIATALALAAHRGLTAPALEWFTHHSEVDVRHAEQGLADLAAYVAYYEFTDAEALTIVEMMLGDHVFARRYFRESAPAEAGR